MPLPISISYFWNLGRILGLLIGLQLLSGLILSMHYVRSRSISFSTVVSIMIDVDRGTLLRYMHCNGSRLLFLIVYLHIFKGIYYNRYDSNKWTWVRGCIVYVLLILTAFLGYVLPWGQIRYWGATVISRLITTIPNVGKWLLVIIWGDYSVSNGVLNRFFALHFLIPFIIIVIVLLHLTILHKKGRTTVIRHNKTILPFSNYFMLKDLVGFIMILILLIINVYYYPSYYLDSENSIIANPIVTPINIVPEWYFLYAYCILKRFESKLLGVWILIIGVIIFPLLATSVNIITYPEHYINSLNSKYFKDSIYHKIRIVMWLANFVILTYLGALQLTAPYTVLAKFCIYIHILPRLLTLQEEGIKWIIDTVLPAILLFIIYIKNKIVKLLMHRGFIYFGCPDKRCCLDIEFCQCCLYHLYCRMDLFYWTL